MLEGLRKELKAQQDPEKAKILQGFFKTGPGEYGEGDIFLGIQVPVLRKLAKKYALLDPDAVSTLLESAVHEERFLALLILVMQFNKGDEAARKRIFDFYLARTDRINNWDLVDLSAEHIVGGFLKDKPKDILYRLARSANLWERRIAMLATFHYIKMGLHEETCRIAGMLIHDRHDLIQKAVGWMLREVGKRCSEEVEETFLRQHWGEMGRTALRYAIERFSPEKRQAYLNGTVGR
ncbi:MAG: DNA alkylation repair enzyme [Syntrophorhabdaceae bacterium PtaU1.Bin034]|nr:MAG: DNA alkylation repair enzyme [Syntrophorhabdaceae bacterium PtaU1.Bin034]